MVTVGGIDILVGGLLVGSWVVGGVVRGGVCSVMVRLAAVAVTVVGSHDIICFAREYYNMGTGL